MTPEQIRTLQRRLSVLGFDPGPIDGMVGKRTVAALHAALDALAPAPPAPAFEVTPGAVALMFPFTPLQNITDNLPFVLAALRKQALFDRPMALMALSTIRAETESFRPVTEGISIFNTAPGAHPFNLYDERTSLGNRGRPDGARYRGRGYIQLTGRYNYTHYGPRIGIPELVEHPERACEPQVAAELLAVFLKDREARIRAALAADDLRTARRLVNGGSHGLERFIDAYRRGSRALGGPA